MLDHHLLCNRFVRIEDFRLGQRIIAAEPAAIVLPEWISCDAESISRAVDDYQSLLHCPDRHTRTRCRVSVLSMLCLVGHCCSSEVVSRPSFDCSCFHMRSDYIMSASCRPLADPTLRLNVPPRFDADCSSFTLGVSSNSQGATSTQFLWHDHMF